MKTQTNSIIRVREVMSTRLITIDGMATVREAAATMRA